MNKKINKAALVITFMTCLVGCDGVFAPSLDKNILGLWETNEQMVAALRIEDSGDGLLTITRTVGTGRRAKAKSFTGKVTNEGVDVMGEIIRYRDGYLFFGTSRYPLCQNSCRR